MKSTKLPISTKKLLVRLRRYMKRSESIQAKLEAISVLADELNSDIGDDILFLEAQSKNKTEGA